MAWFGVVVMVALASGNGGHSLAPAPISFVSPYSRFPIPYSLPSSPPAHHPTHVTYGRLDIEAKRVTLKIRMFRDDLEKALALSSRQARVAAQSTPGMDSLFVAYFAARIVLVADGATLEGKVTGSGAQNDMWWYLVQFPTPKPVEKLALSNRIFFELFNDQQNLLKVVDTASGEESSLYFVAGEPGPVTLTFSR